MPTDMDLQPDPLEVIQAENIGPEPNVRVDVATVETPVRTQSLPRKAGSTKTWPVGATTPVQVLRADHHRASAVLMSIGQNMLIALSPATAQSPQPAVSMALWPANVPYTVTADTEVWVLSATGTTSVSVITEMWAAGD